MNNFRLLVVGIGRYERMKQSKVREIDAAMSTAQNAPINSFCTSNTKT